MTTTISAWQTWEIPGLHGVSPSIMTCASCWVTQYQRDYDSSLKSSRYICGNQNRTTIIISLSCHAYAWYKLLLYVSSILIMSIMWLVTYPLPPFLCCCFFPCRDIIFPDRLCETEDAPPNSFFYLIWSPCWKCFLFFKKLSKLAKQTLRML